MNIKQFTQTGIATLALLAFTLGHAEESTKQSAASRQASKARAQASQENEGPSDRTSGSTTGAAGLKDSDNTPLLDSGTLDKAAQEANDTMKKMDKVLDGY